MKPDERELLLAVAARCRPFGRGECVRDVCNEIGVYKRNLYLLDKWTRKGWYDWGVSLDLGWLTEEGLEAARREGWQQ